MILMKKHPLFILSIFSFLISRADTDSVIYHYECKTCPRYILTFHENTITKCVRLDEKGDTVYYWDLSRALFVNKSRGELYGFITSAEERAFENIERRKQGQAPLKDSYDDGVIMEGPVESNGPAKPILSLKEQKAKYLWENNDRIEEDKRNQIFYRTHVDGYTSIYESADFKVVFTTRQYGVREGDFKKFYKGKLVVSGQYNNNKAHGLWLFYPYSLSRIPDIRWFNNSYKIMDEGKYGGLSLLYFGIPLILLFVFLFLSIKYKWYATYFYSLIGLASLLILLAIKGSHAMSFIISIGIICALITLLSFINILLGKKSGTLLIINILILLAGIALIFLVYAVSHMGKIGG
jgi:hypothetical protein